MALHLHIGTHDGDKVESVGLVGVTVFRNGDSWEEWGERRGDGVEHIVIESDAFTPLQMLGVLMLLEGEGVTLQAMLAPPHQRGALAVVTTHEDWSDPLLLLTDPQHR